MSDFIGVDITGLKELQTKLAKLPDAVADEGVQAGNEYMVQSLHAYPPYKYVTRKAAYGQTFVSDKQRRYVMARIREGTITPGRSNRTQAFSRGWKIVGHGRRGIVANETPYGGYLMGDDTQARQPGLVGWKKLGAVVKERTLGIVKAFDGAVKKAIRKVGL